MKNIHILPTDKARLYIHQGKLYDNKKTMHIPDGTQIPQNIYITNDEEIKEGEYGIDIRDSKVFKCERTLSNHYEFGVLQFQKSYCKKIILTTDQDLIADGVQAIDDEFLEWFVKNPSCERVEVDLDYDSGLRIINGKNLGYYSIIIPQEEPKQFSMNADLYENHSIVLPELPKQEKERGITITHVGKQETLEETAERLYSEDIMWGMDLNKDTKNAFIQGAKWQQERSYSEEDLISFAHFYFTEEFNSSMQTSKQTKDIFTEWFEQFKKK
jgi:hypothetical protein